MAAFPIDEVRSKFPGLQRMVDGRQAIFFDGPGGSQSPDSVGDAVRHYLLHQNANVGMSFATSVETDRLIDDALRACADFVGCENHREIVFGQNMTSLTIQLASALSRTWNPGDEVVVTRLDHDSNVHPWMLAAEWSGATLRRVDIDPDGCTHNRSSLEDSINERRSIVGTAIGVDVDPDGCTHNRSSLEDSINENTVLVAVGAASNLSGTINDVSGIAEKAHAVGAEVFVDAVHYAPHCLINVEAMGCDYLACSSYKFFGTHQGVLWGRSKRLAELPVAKLRVTTEEIPFRWMTGTQSHEAMAGTIAAIEHIAWIGRCVSDGDLSRREALGCAFEAIEEYEQSLCWRMIDGLQALDGVKIWGITDSERKTERAPTVSFTHDSMSPKRIADALAERGIFVWEGNFYALELTEALGLEPEGVLRVGVLHYNTMDEVDRFLDELADILSS